ncbi:MAG TPA: hypothetical protein QF870_09760 [Nitrospinota bacterium]|jgi:hypothetical protein|nr:hypothetical protein [Nitrospinota bacterium]
MATIGRITPLNIQELVMRFPEIPEDLHEEPLLARFAETFGDPLSIARPPTPCSTERDAANHYYVKLLNPIVFYRLGLGTREKALEHVQTLLDGHAADAGGFVASLLPADVAAREVRGPGCD